MSRFFKTLGILTGCLFVALVLGMGSAWWFLNARFDDGLTNGAWTVNADIASDAATPHARAIVARARLLAMNKSETIYFLATADDHGEPLTTNCTYKLNGEQIGTRWWSITAYGADHFLIPNQAKRYSRAMNTVERNSNNSFTITLSPQGYGVNGIPTGFDDGGEAETFSLTLRLYNPEEETYSNLEQITLPTITRETCS